MVVRISIHAPRTGSDEVQCMRMRYLEDFNPRSPHGERPSAFFVGRGDYDFNPRSPHGERQHHRDARAYSPLISIHAPRTGSDK